MTDWYDIRKIAPGVHLLCGKLAQENSYLVVGEEYAALIDTGRGLGDIRPPAELLTPLPIIVLNTHGHWDHIGGNHLFQQIGAHALEADFLRNPRVPARVHDLLIQLRDRGMELPAGIVPEEFTVEPSEPTFFLEQGQVIELGGRQLQVWHTPGHSAGSLCFVDEGARILFSGDTVMEGSIALHMPGASADDLLQSFETLAQMAWDIDLVLPGHGTAPADGRLILELADGLRRTLAGEAPMKKGLSVYGAARIAAFERFSFFLPPDWHPVGGVKQEEKHHHT